MDGGEVIQYLYLSEGIKWFSELNMRIEVKNTHDGFGFQAVSRKLI